MDRLGGRIYVESQEGLYAKFTVDIPLDQPPVVASTILERLSGTTVICCCQQEDTTAHMASIFESYNIPFRAITSLNDMAQTKPDSGGIYCYLVDEDMYDKDTFRQYRPAKSMLMTFGPMFSVKETQVHFRSVTQILPTLLLGRIADTLAGSQQNGKALRHSPSDVSGSIPYKDLRVLIVEDNMVNQKVIKRIVNRLGVQHVVVANNGQEAVDKEAGDSYDLILMDNQMPVMDGIQACRIICSRRQHPPVVFVTAHVSESFKEACLEAGAVSFLAKPCSVQSVQQCIENVLTEQSQKD